MRKRLAVIKFNSKVSSTDDTCYLIYRSTHVTTLGTGNRWWVNSMPPLSTCNCFKILSNINDSKASLPDMQNLEEILKPSPFQNKLPQFWKPKWEKTLPEKCIILAAGESNSLKLKIELETMDTSERKAVNSLVDSRATGEFIDWEYAKSGQFNLQKSTHPILVYNIDGSPNEASSITKAVSLILW